MIIIIAVTLTGLIVAGWALTARMMLSPSVSSSLIFILDKISKTILYT